MILNGLDFISGWVVGPYDGFVGLASSNVRTLSAMGIVMHCHVLNFRKKKKALVGVDPDL